MGENNTFGFGEALDLLGRGTKVARQDWAEGRVLQIEEEKLTEELVSEDLLAVDWVVVESASEEAKKENGGEEGGEAKSE